MTTDKTFVVNDQATETDALDFMPREAVETLADIIQTGNTPLTMACSARSRKQQKKRFNWAQKPQDL
jgi:hypothetical protein